MPLIAQEQDAWCWNGVSKSALDYYGEVREQCEIAEYVRTVTSRGFGNTPCCENPTGPCNQGNAIYNEDGSIQDILHHFAGITSEYKGQFGRTEADVANSIARNAVVPCGWLWAAGGGHAVLIHGYISGNVYYMDPWYGEGKKIASYSNFSSGSDGSDAGHHTWITGIYFTSDVTQTDTVVPCDAPNSITVSNISGSSVDLNWPVIASAQSYKIRYRAQGSSTWTNTSSSANSKVITNLSGTTTYEFQVAAVCNSVSESDFSSTATATTLEGPVVYCTSNGNSVDGEWINSVVFGSINNNSNANGGYADFTAQSTSITAGTSANITLTPGFASSWLFGTTTQPEFWSIWIDLNQDGDFDDANELQYVSPNSNSGYQAFSVSLSIPASAALGETRLRIAMKRGSAANSCEALANGEVEDYTVNIVSSVGGSGRITAVGLISELESSVYPNPASDVVNIKLSIPSNSSTVTINLLDISGKWIQGETFESTNSDKTTTYQMSLNQLTQGIYLVEVVTNTGDRQLQKLIVN